MQADQEPNGDGHLQDDFLRGGQAQVAVFDDLDEVVQKADHPGAERQKQHHHAGSQLLRAQDLRRTAVEDHPHQPQRDQDAKDKAQAAHGGGAVFLVVPGGAFLADRLAKMQAVQSRDQQPAGHSGHGKAADRRGGQQSGDSLLHAVIPPNHVRHDCANALSRLWQPGVVGLQQIFKLHGMAGFRQQRVTGLYKLL